MDQRAWSLAGVDFSEVGVESRGVTLVGSRKKNQDEDVTLAYRNKVQFIDISLKMHPDQSKHASHTTCQN